MDNFQPAYTFQGFKDKTEAFQGIFKQLLQDQKRIIRKGFQTELRVSLGKEAIILRGKTKGVDRSKEKS